MDTFIKWLIGDMGTTGEYMYKAIHWYSLIVVVLVSLILVVLQCRINTNVKHKQKLIVWVKDQT